MIPFTTIADDVTGACDVAAELAAAGHRVRVAIDAAAPVAPSAAAFDVVNTQSRALDPGDAYARVRTALGERRTPVVLKKIDTALRGHLGAEIDGALDALGGSLFVLAAIPKAGRVTRDGCQWFDGRLLAATEFARDPEGPGAESSIPAVVARESRRRAVVIGRDVVQESRLAPTVAAARQRGDEVFVVDAESDDDVAAAVAAILTLPSPVCLAGSIALAAALMAHCEAPVARPTDVVALPLPVVIVNGSLHSRARFQCDAVIAAGLAVPVSIATGGGDAELERASSAARALVAAGRSVVVTPAAPTTAPDDAALRANERRVSELLTRIAEPGRIASLVLIGGQTSHAVLTRLGARTLTIAGRFAPLVAHGTIEDGAAAGAMLVTKGGSGGAVDALVSLLTMRSPAVGATA